MRIEVLEKRISDVDADTGKHRVMVKGDVLTVPDAYGARMCALGWVKDLDGKVKTEERIPGPQMVTPHKLTIKARGK